MFWNRLTHINLLWDPLIAYWLEDLKCKTLIIYRLHLFNMSTLLPVNVHIMKTSLFKYIENFTSQNWKNSDKKKKLMFFIVLLKT